MGVVRCCYSYFKFFFVINLLSSAAGDLIPVSETALRDVLFKKLFFKITQCSLEKSVFKKAAGLTTATLLTETPTKVFFREYCENFEKKYFEEHLRMAASAASWLFLLEWSRVESIYLSILDLHRNRNVIILHFLQ